MTQTNNPSAASFLVRYDMVVAQGKLTQDSAQRAVVIALSELCDRLCGTNSPPSISLLRRLLGKHHSSHSTQGLYIWGGVGRGKSLLMDKFFAFVPIPQKRRVHFHAFMLDIHQRLHAWRQIGTEDDILLRVVTEIASATRVLCLDEFQVSDVTDAMILSRLFQGLWDAGVTVIMTSNRHPRHLYPNGLQRDQFLKFVDVAEQNMRFIELASAQDYRLKQLASMQKTYVTPLDDVADDFLQSAWQSLTEDGRSYRLDIPVSGRVLRIDKHNSGVAWLTFDELCARPLGADDYLKLATMCHTILLQNIPQMSAEYRNEAKRFVTLIDALYEHRTKLIATAAAPPDDLYPSGDGSFEFARTASRLHEMQSATYMALPRIA